MSEETLLALAAIVPAALLVVAAVLCVVAALRDRRRARDGLMVRSELERYARDVGVEPQPLESYAMLRGRVRASMAIPRDTRSAGTRTA